MADIIQLLPEFVANQIAAGEVVNRPSSAVKELLENSIDAKSSHIQLIIEDGGKTLIQVIDNGVGMSARDTVQCFLKHATSKIKAAEDLFNIRTMGFRGEALSSISSVAHIELKTKPADQDLGTLLTIKGGDILSQEECACEKGTSFAVRNLYYNTPARRQFLKINSTEFRYIEEEFLKVALSNPQIGFSLHNDGVKLYDFTPCKLNQRILQLFGNSFQSRLVPIEQNLSDIKIHGYICKAEYASKNRSKQYLFVNNRYIKHKGLNHAIESAFSEILPTKNYPVYFIFMEVDPTKIDVNIHPTKTEVRFADEKLIYGLLLSSAKYAIGIHNLKPSLDFEASKELEIPIGPRDYFPPAPSIKVNPDYNPFNLRTQKPTSPVKGKNYLENLSEFFKGNTQEHAIASQYENTIAKAPVYNQEELFVQENIHEYLPSQTLQYKSSYIVYTEEQGILIVDQQAAHERILYEHYLHSGIDSPLISQRTLFPQTLEFSSSHADLIKDIKGDLSLLGWDIEWLGDCSFVVNSMPVETPEDNLQVHIENILDGFKFGLMQPQADKSKLLASAMAKQLAVKRGHKLTPLEMTEILQQLFACKYPKTSPSNQKTFNIIKHRQILDLFVSNENLI